jgi:orotidine-5'-phosphate decarboxylase
MELSQLQKLVNHETGIENIVSDDPRIIVALDYADQKQAISFVDKISPDLCKLKVGKQLFTRCGPKFVESLVAKGFDVFLDLKFHDIPNTVKQAVYAAGQLGVWMVNVHALGGASMLVAAREGVEMVGVNRPYLIAVSLLTSMSASDLLQLGIEQEPQEFVERLSRLAIDSGLDGLVCSAREARGLRQILGDDPLLVTPGIRPEGSTSDDQQRISTPQQAITDGASYLVIGRPITRHPSPSEALMSIEASLSNIQPYLSS